MKCTTHKSPAGITTIAERQDEALLVVEDRSREERIDVEFTSRQIRVYSNETWVVTRFKRNGTPIETDNPLVAVTMQFRDGAVLRQGFKTPVPQVKAMPALGRFVADLGGELDIEPG